MQDLVFFFARKVASPFDHSTSLHKLNWSTCEFVSPGLACTCDDLLTSVESKFARKSTSPFYLATQPKSRKLSDSILCYGNLPANEI